MIVIPLTLLKCRFVFFWTSVVILIIVGFSIWNNVKILIFLRYYFPVIFRKSYDVGFKIFKSPYHFLWRFICSGFLYEKYEVKELSIISYSRSFRFVIWFFLLLYSRTFIPILCLLTSPFRDSSVGTSSGSLFRRVLSFICLQRHVKGLSRSLFFLISNQQIQKPFDILE